MSGALTAWLSTPDRYVGLDYDPHSLQFSRDDRGGYAEGSLRLKAPISSRNPLLSPMTRLTVTDARTGRVAWEGYLDIPGKTKGADGEVWEIGAIGPKARLLDRQLPYILIDQTFDSWEFRFASNGNMTAGPSAHPDDESTDCLLFNWPQGIAIGNNSRVAMVYRRIANAGQLVGGFSVTHDDGSNDATNNKFQIGGEIQGTPGTSVIRNRPLSTTPETVVASAGTGGFPTNFNMLVLRRFRESGGATNVSGDLGWCAVTQIRVSAQRRDITGAYVTGLGSYAADYVLAHEVITDALWHFDTALDPELASIDTSFTHQIDQLAYTDPVTFQQVLDDLALLEPDLRWEILEAGPNGHRSTFRRIPDGVRYLADASGGWQSPGSDADLRNAVTITWTGPNGNAKAKTFTSEVPELDRWGIVREADVVELADEIGSEANANRIGPAILKAAAAPPTAGTLTVDQPIHDTYTGQDVMPWEIEPGYRISIQDVDIDPIPITEVSYQGGVATLTCGEPVLTVEQIVNQLARKRKKR